MEMDGVHPFGVDGDQYPNDPTQCCDTDGDGWGDNPNGKCQTDIRSTQLSGLTPMAMGLGDNPDGANPDPFPGDYDNDESRIAKITS